MHCSPGNSWTTGRNGKTRQRRRRRPPANRDEESMKNGQEAVMESITRKLETQDVQVRAAADTRGRDAVDLTTWVETTR